MYIGNLIVLYIQIFQLYIVIVIVTTTTSNFFTTTLPSVESHYLPQNDKPSPLLILHSSRVSLDLHPPYVWSNLFSLYSLNITIPPWKIFYTTGKNFH